MRSPALHVAVGVIHDGHGNILLTQRAKHAHQGGLWEFPGGKLEGDETVPQALQRELLEEVGICVKTARPLIKINHQYPDVRVLLDVWQVNDFSGTAHACEGQAMRWVRPQQLKQFTFPAANLPIVTAARLPDRYAILEGKNHAEVLLNLDRILQTGATILQVRIKSAPISERSAICASVLERCKQENIITLLNSDLSISATAANGIHLSSRELRRLVARPAAWEWVAASCHNLEELEHAERIGADFAVLAPILPTSTHPDTTPLGWDTLTKLTSSANLPVYALGGLELTDIDRAIEAGAQGIAGISAFLR